MIKILLDQGMPRSAVAHLRDSGWDAVHAYDIGLGRTSDQAILERARDDGRIVITLDADFHALLAITNATAPSVIRIRRKDYVVPNYGSGCSVPDRSAIPAGIIPAPLGFNGSGRVQ